jgi:hypothetical protein
MEDLTLPGTIPGLLRPGSVIIHETEGEGVVLRVYGTPANTVARKMMHNSVDAGFHGNGDLSCYAEAVIEYSAVVLDLTDATSRAHAAWWLAAALGLPSPVGAHWVSYGLGWRLTVHQLSDDPEPSRDVPALDDLDPADDTRLPDGSRRVDAIALGRVCRHVAAAQAALAG